MAREHADALGAALSARFDAATGKAATVLVHGLADAVSARGATP